ARALNPLLAVLTSEKAKLTSGDRRSPFLKAQVFGYAANRVWRVSGGWVPGIDFLLLPGQYRIKSQCRPGKNPIAIFTGQRGQSRLGNFQQFQQRSLR